MSRVACREQVTCLEQRAGVGHGTIQRLQTDHGGEQDGGRALKAARRVSSKAVGWCGPTSRLPWPPASLVVCPLKRSLSERAHQEGWGRGPLLGFWRLVSLELLLAQGGDVRQLSVAQEVAKPVAPAAASAWQTVRVCAGWEVLQDASRRRVLPAACAHLALRAPRHCYLTVTSPWLPDVGGLRRDGGGQGELAAARVRHGKS